MDTAGGSRRQGLHLSPAGARAVRLATVRRATLVSVRGRAGRPRVREQVEEGEDEQLQRLAATLKVGHAPPPAVAYTRRRR